MKKNCNKCINYIGGSCSSWECHMETLKEFKSRIIRENEREKLLNKKENGTNLISEVDFFLNVCKKKLVEWCDKRHEEDPMSNPQIDINDVFVVWSCKTLQNYKCLISTNISDGIYAEYTYNGDKRELYEDVYKKVTNTCYK